MENVEMNIINVSQHANRTKKLHLIINKKKHIWEKSSTNFWTNKGIAEGERKLKPFLCGKARMILLVVWINILLDAMTVQ